MAHPLSNVLLDVGVAPLDGCAERKSACQLWKQMKPVTTGFTLLEMMVVIAVLAIVMSIAVPSFQGVARNSRTSSVANELLSALILARSEAVRRGKTVMVCRSDTSAVPPSCNGTSWTDGWLVFVGTGAGSGDEAVANHIKVGQIKSAGIQIDAPADETGFSANGASTAAGTFTISPACVSGDGNKNRILEISPAGRVSITTGDC